MERNVWRLISEGSVPSVGAMLLAIGLVSGACGSEEPPVQDQEIVGSWLLVEMMSKDYSGYLTQLGEPPVFSFMSSGTWEGTDGCNNLHGEFTLGAEGHFEAEAQSTTDVGCDLPAKRTIPAIAVLLSASEVDVTDGLLELRDTSGAVIGQFARQAP
jgi:hypothetical protein